MKHIIQKLVILVLAIGLLTVGASAASFPDVDAGAWYSDAVKYVSELGIIVGDIDGNFNPDKTVTRAEMAAVICRTLEKTLSEDEYMPVYLEAENFWDVPENHWANGYINKVSFLEIASGYGDGRFGPSDCLTYEQAVTLIVRMLGAGKEASERGGYPDGFLNVADSMGLLSGVHAAKGNPLSRANVAVLLFNCLYDDMDANPPMDKDFTDTSTDKGSQIGGDIGSPPVQDGPIGDSLEIGDLQQEDQPGSGSESGGIGGGT